ncbi:flagellar rod assembly protein/muramidase FlgJ [Lonsdalea iberica]|uniref:Peptidoglycan hydrolase FlgJ n=1 Tax=Lonsdalea iberica TaxID=1082703 RepID=A0A1X3RPZ7_9GAMM|nr:flagellar assembly peptidoglycan hydrolase FlgJ [Lonsdalea iberica]OSN03879.1 flagellar rod assembly protein/muramidase FlgJ [Lonsdalea iberica]OSN05140.1 flagellar rod assembly protein/muramidase FlgJ [Lonsdalea iberica]
MMKLDNTSSVDQASAAYDVKSLNKLRNDAVKNDPSALKKVAKQVEGLFVNMMLKSMRSALPKDGLLSSDQTRLYTSMYDQQVAQDLSAKGLGLADMMVKQLSRNVNEPPGNGVGTTPMPLSKDDFSTSSAFTPALMGEFLKRNNPDQQGESATKSQPELAPSSEDFTHRLSMPSMIASLKTGIPHHLIMAQAALESGWGKREITTSDGKPSHNLFGVKAGSNWDGKVTEIVTTEFENGRAYKVKEKFRVYDSYLDSINDYISLLTDNARYKGVVNANSAEAAAYELQRAGYATDPRYGDKLVQIIGQIKNTTEKAVKAYTHDISNLF